MRASGAQRVHQWSSGGGVVPGYRGSGNGLTERMMWLIQSL